MSIRFAELPAGRASSAWSEEADALRSNPGQWAHFEDYDAKSTSDRTNLTQNIKRGNLKAFKEGRFEARVIKGQVWARFIADAE